MLARLIFRLAVAETAVARTQVPLLNLSRLSTRICLRSSIAIPQGIIIKEEVGFLRRIVLGLNGPIAEWGSKEGTSLWAQKKAFPLQR
jgi:hypothetical protein